MGSTPGFILRGLGSIPDRGHCVVLFALAAPLSTQVYKCNAGGNPAMD